MSQGEAFPVVAEIISAADFWGEENQAIYQTIEALFARHADIDRVTLTYELAATNKLQEIGGEPYISRIISTSIGAVYEETIAYHARLIKETSTLRRLLSMLDQAKDMVDNGKQSAAIRTYISDHISRLDMESRILVINSLTIIKSDPPIYRAKVWDQHIDFTLEEITDWTAMRKRIISVCDKVPTKHKDHDQFIHNALDVAAKIEAPLDASTRTQINESIERFFDRNVESDDHADLMAGSYMVRPIENVNHLLFFARPLKRWLKQDLEKIYTESTLWAFLSQQGGITHEVRVKKGKGSTSVKLWAVPRDTLLPPDNVPSDF